MSKVIALVTLYNPDKENFENIELIASQVDFTYICDNSPQASSDLFNIPKTQYVFNNANLGLSNAFNKILKSDKFEDKDFLIFFDQDSKIEKNHINKLVNRYKKLEKEGIKVGALGPVVYDNSSNTQKIPKNKIKVEEDSYEVATLITSSLLISYKALKDISFWNEEVFLDLADKDLCWRLTNNGYKNILALEPVLNHNLGTGVKRIGPFSLKIGAPLREYYQTRDALFLFNKGYVPFSYKLRILATVTIRPILHILFLDNKKERRSFIKKGFKDFKAKKLGAL